MRLCGQICGRASEILCMTAKGKKTIKTALILIAAGVCYLAWIRLTGLALPCVFRSLTGFKCPGCGITTMFAALASLDFRASFNANPFLFVTAPFLCGEIIYREYLKCKDMKVPGAHEAAVICYAIALCIFGIVRNLAEYGIL